MPYIAPLEKYLGKRKKYSGEFDPIPALENYTPAPPSPPSDFPGQGEMMDISRRDSPNFGKWMREAGGFHFDEAQRGFVPDKMGRDFMQEISAVMERGGNVMDQVFTRFKERMARAPKQALLDMSARSADNPAGYATDAMLGELGAPGALATMLGAGSDAVRGMRLGTVGGALAKGFQEAKAAGKTWMGLEGAPKFEINDAAATLKGLPKALQESKLSEVIDHPELFKNYPGLAEIKVKKIIPTLANAGERGSFNSQTGEIMVEAGDEAKSTLLHEIQHAIQDRENFAKGGRPEGLPEALQNDSEQLRKQARKFFDLGQREKGMELEKQARWLDSIHVGSTYAPGEAYRRLGGEVEARNVQGRMNMTAAERQARPFNETFDVPAEQQIIRRRNVPASLQDFFAEMDRLKS